jgi:hypothetical protein
MPLYGRGKRTSVTVNRFRIHRSNEYSESINTYDLAFLGWKYVKNTLVCQLHSWYRKIGLIFPIVGFL